MPSFEWFSGRNPHFYDVSRLCLSMLYMGTRTYPHYSNSTTCISTKNLEREINECESLTIDFMMWLNGSYLLWFIIPIISVHLHPIIG